jgi:hypothetical protein
MSPHHIENNLPGTSKVWIYQSSRKFTEREAEAINQKIKEFVTQWTSHKAGVIGDGLLLYNYFIVLMADESQVGVSGCSIDSSAHFVKGLGTEYRANFFDRWNLAYIKDGEVTGIHRDEFEKLLNTGEINDETIVFNNLLHTKADFETKWQVPYRESWLKNLRVAHISFSSIL